LNNNEIYNLLIKGFDVEIQNNKNIRRRRFWDSLQSNQYQNQRSSGHQKNETEIQ